MWDATPGSCCIYMYVYIYIYIYVYIYTATTWRRIP